MRNLIWILFVSILMLCNLQDAACFGLDDAFTRTVPEKALLAMPKQNTKPMVALSGLMSGLSVATSNALAVTSDLPEGELVDLPPPFVPVLLAVVILGGVGVLTSSLGDVISDGTLVKMTAK